MAAPAPPRRQHDALSVFTLVFAQCLALQVAKDAQAFSTWEAVRELKWDAPESFKAIVPTSALAASIAIAHVAPKSDRALVALALSGVLVLCVNGAQSNHVFLELAIALAVLFTAPLSALIGFGGDGARGDDDAVDVDGKASRAALELVETSKRQARRDAFSARMTLAMRGLLVVLYAATGFAKLNDAWHDPATSCCVQMLLGTIAGMGVGASLNPKR